MAPYFSRFSPYLTSYDFLKFFAVVTMVVDHVGFFFYPEENWFRIVGRMSFPCWMFLIGYANTREIPKSFYVGGVLIVLANFVFSNIVFPITLFVTFALTRLLLDRMASMTFRSAEKTTVMFWTLMILAFPTYMLFEYGTLAFLVALFGYAVRHKEDINLGKYFVPIFSVAVMTGFIGLEILFFGLSGMQAWTLAGSLSAVGLVLFHFKPKTYPDLTAGMPSIPKWILQFCGHYSLEIYVGHLVLLIAVSKLMSPDFVWFTPKMFP